MKPSQVQIVKKIILVVEWAIFLGLLIGVVLFVQNVWLDYLSKATSVKQYSETYQELEAKLSRNLNEKFRLLKFVENTNFYSILAKIITITSLNFSSLEVSIF